MVCPKCGGAVDGGDVFCRRCGAAVSGAAPGFRAPSGLDEGGAYPPDGGRMPPPTPYAPPPPRSEPPRSRPMRRISAGKEFRLLTMQYLRILLGDVKNLAVCLAFPVIAAFITVWIAGEDMFVNFEGTKSACFVLVSASIWGGLFNSIQTIVRERANIKRDLISGGLRLGCYTGSRAVLQLVLCALQSAILCLAFYGVAWRYDNEMPASGVLFGTTIVEFYISILLLTFAADTMGLMISSIVRKEETASVMAPYILIVQLIFSGILFTMEGGAEIVSYAMLSRWGMEAMGSIADLNALPMRLQAEYPMLTHEAEEMFEATAAHLLSVWGVLLGFSVLFLVVGNLFLHNVKKDQR